MTDQTNWAKVLGELIADHEYSCGQQAANALAPLVARLGNIEARPTVVMLPPELAIEVASAARLLHELPPIVSRETPAARVTRIERDESGALVPIYDGPQA